MEDPRNATRILSVVGGANNTLAASTLTPPNHMLP
jgi:hypothetical protein